MAIGSGLLALAMVAVDGPSCPPAPVLAMAPPARALGRVAEVEPSACPPVETMTYQVRVHTMDGLEWRTSCYSRLSPVTHQGTSTIWTADKALAASLADRAKGTSPCHTIMAVGEAELSKADAVNYIAAMDRVADGPVNQSSAIAFVPRPERVEEKFAIRVSGRKLDQGILTTLAIEETHVDVIHDVAQTESLVPSRSKAGQAPESPSSETRTEITSSVQVPEVTRASVGGEWLIPNDGVLIISLGVKTASGEGGKAVARERIAVIEACTGTPCTAGHRPIAAPSPVPIASAVTPASFEHVKLGTPVVPGRSMPQAVDAQGNVLELPPLPEALASADLDRIKPESFQPTPQAPHVKSTPAPSVDPALARTGFDVAPPAPMAPEGVVEVFGEDINIEVSDVIEALIKADQKVDMGQVFFALLKAGVKFEKVPDLNPRNFIPTKLAAEKCDADSTVCPAVAKALKASQAPGGMETAAVGPTMISKPFVPQLGIVIKDVDGAQVADAGVKMKDVFRNPGKTETVVIPLHGCALEVKATLVPTPAEKVKAATLTEDSAAEKR